MTIRGFDTCCVGPPMTMIAMRQFQSYNHMIQAGGRVARKQTVGTREFWQTELEASSGMAVVDTVAMEELKIEIAEMVQTWGQSQVVPNGVQ